jgi:hypothetical protein
LARSNDEVSDTLAVSEFRLKKMAQASLRVNKGLDDLTTGWVKWGNAIHTNNKSSAEYAQAMENIRVSLADTLNTNEDFISNDFIAEYFDTISKAAYGDTVAIEDLRKAMS